MPNNLKIRVGVEGGKTDSKFTVQEGGAITLKNDANATLQVSFGNSSPLCLGTERQLSVELAAGQTKAYQACNVATEQSFKYTATVANTQLENAYIIVEKPMIVTPELVVPETNPIIVIHRELTGENLFFAATGLLIGVVLSLFVENRWGPGRNRPRP
jgi:hypothetical protein